MKIAIDLTPLYGRIHTGLEMYAIDLYSALCKTEHEIIPIFHQKNELDDNPCSVIINKSNRYILETFLLPMKLRQIHPDIALFPIFPPALLCYNIGVKIIPVIHDVAFLDYRKTLSWKARMYLIPRFSIALKKSFNIITISETIKNKLLSYATCPVCNCGENISEIYKNVSLINKSYLQKWNLCSNEYLISVSTIEPRKNLKYLLIVLGDLIKNNNLKLVLVGRKGWGNDNQLKYLIESLDKYLIFTDYVSVDELMTLYHYAHSFILLSLDEGFGRTPFEAVACGCKRIILSDIPVFRENFEGNATFLPLRNADLAKSLLNMGCLSQVDTEFELPYDIIENRIDKFLNSLM